MLWLNFWYLSFVWFWIWLGLWYCFCCEVVRGVMWRFLRVCVRVRLRFLKCWLIVIRIFWWIIWCVWCVVGIVWRIMFRKCLCVFIRVRDVIRNREILVYICIGLLWILCVWMSDVSFVGLSWCFCWLLSLINWRLMGFCCSKVCWVLRWLRLLLRLLRVCCWIIEYWLFFVRLRVGVMLRLLSCFFLLKVWLNCVLIEVRNVWGVVLRVIGVDYEWFWCKEVWRVFWFGGGILSFFLCGGFGGFYGLCCCGELL